MTDENKSMNEGNLKMSISRCILDSIKNVEKDHNIKIPMKTSIAKRLTGNMVKLLERRLYVK